MSNRILIAQIGAAHGIKGEVRVKAFGDDPLSLGEFGALTSEAGKRFKIKALRPAKGSMLVVRFDGVGDRTAAEALNGTQLFVDREQLPAPEDGEFYHTDLIGCTVVDEAGIPVGTVIGVPNFGAGDLLDIRLEDGTTTFVPFDDTYVPEIDIEANRIVVSSLDSLLSDDEPKNAD